MLLFGVPSGVAMGLVFSHYTPARERGAGGLPMYSDGREDVGGGEGGAGEGGGGAARACCGVGARAPRGRGGRCAGLGHARVLIWIWPKLLCFVLVVLTHYQLLRYVGQGERSGPPPPGSSPPTRPSTRPSRPPPPPPTLRPSRLLPAHWHRVR